MNYLTCILMHIGGLVSSSACIITSICLLIGNATENFGNVHLHWNAPHTILLCTGVGTLFIMFVMAPREYICIDQYGMQTYWLNIKRTSILWEDISNIRFTAVRTPSICVCIKSEKKKCIYMEASRSILDDMLTYAPQSIKEKLLRQMERS